jgi:SWI/SNF related-matrix-associated actin-dependent regulator of chromatin subfamily C
LAQRYQSARNFLVRHFRSQVPRRFVSLTETLRLVTGDAQLLTRIHSLLDAWGIINHLVDPGVGPIAMVAGSSNSSYPLLAQSAYEQLQQAPVAPTALAAAKAAAAVPVAASAHAAHPNRPMDALQQLILDCSGTSAATSLSTRRSVLLGPSQAASTEPLVAEYAARRNPAQSLQCSVCASPSVESVRYVCRQRREYICCSACFLGGRYAPLLSSADFERLLSAVSDEEQQAPVQPEAAAATTAAGGEWGREEVLRLLQGVALHEQDWEAVAEHVGSRSKDECVLKFLQMPIEEPFLEQWFNTLAPEAGLPSAKDQSAVRIATASASSSTAATTATKATVPSSSASSAAAAGTGTAMASTTTTVLAHNIPFRDAPNPLLSQVSFLSTYVSPSVGAAAAQAVLSYMSVRDMDGVPVHTPFGPGRIVVAPPAIPAAAADGNMTVSPAFAHTSFTRADGIVTVALPWGRLYAHASALSVDKEAHRALERAKQRATATAAASSNKAAPEPIWQRELVPLTHHLLQAAARKAVELAEEEERKVLRYVAQITGLLMKRVELKLAHLGELDEWSATQAVAYDAGAIKNHNERNAAIAAAQAAVAAAALAASPSPSPPHPQQHQPQPSPPMPSPQRPQVF